MSDTLKGTLKKAENESRLDKIINYRAVTLSELDYVYSCLMAYKQIIESGCCNDCYYKPCDYTPDPGRLVRYNCPFYRRLEERKREGEVEGQNG